MIEFYKNNFNFKDTYDKFISVIDYLDKISNPLEIEKLHLFSTPTDISEFVPMLKDMYKNHLAVNKAISSIFNIENYSEYKIDDVSDAIIGNNYLIINRIIFFINPLSIEAQSIADSIKDYDSNEILFEKTGIILEDQIREISNKINIQAVKKKVSLTELSMDKIFQDLVKSSIDLKSSKIKIFVEDNLVKANFYVEGFYLRNKEIILTSVNNYNDVKTMLKAKFDKGSVEWKHFTEFYKIVLHADDKQEFLYMDIYNLSAIPNDIDNIALKDKDKKILMNALKSPSGVIVISGGSNSGKRSLMYSILTHVRDNIDGINIVTYEDEVKNKINGITQNNNVPIKENDLKHYTVVAIDKGNNSDIFNIAYNIASQGKLVILIVETSSIFNTLTFINNAISDKEYILENTLSILHTGLLNCVCKSCSNDIQFSKNKDSHFFVSLENSPKMTDIIKEELKEGCDECNYGYTGRIQVTEILENDVVLKDLYTKGFNITNYKTEKRSKSWNNNYEISMKLLSEGKISLNSIIKVLGYYKK
jgi:type IV pilus assembly protein PilB